MRKPTLIGLFAVWAGFNSVGWAQVSTFPSPPPLAPSPDQSSDTSTNNFSGMPSVAPPATGGDTSGVTSGASPANTSPSTPGAGSGAPTSSFLQTPASPDTGDTPITAATLNSMSALDDKVTLEAGDRISFRVIEDRDEAVPRVVTDTGEVDFPYVGRLKVSGQTCRQVADQLKKLLEVDYYKRATVIVGLDVIVGHASADVPHDVAWIVGQVRQVGPQELSKLQPMTVSQIILRAGGFGDFADDRKVRLVHRSAVTNSPNAVSGEGLDGKNTPEGETVDVKSVFKGESTFDPIVKPNDLIIVPKKLVNF